jgi:signal transduction histidine kinase
VGNEVLVIVEDDGHGFDPLAAAEATDREGGFGLFSIRERMLDLDGVLEIVSEPGQGCTAILAVPLGNG